MAAEPYLAFFDDSGTPQPDNPKAPFVLGAVVMPFRVFHEVSGAWWNIVKTTCEIKFHPPQVQFEPKHVDFVEYLNRLHANRDMSGRFQAFRTFKLDAKKVSACTEALLSFIAEREDVTLLAFAMHKEDYWQRWHSWDFERFSNARKLGLKKADEKELRASLANAVTSKAFEWGILERLHFLMQEKDNSHAMLIGDASATEDQWHRMQDRKQRADIYNRYTDAKNVVCNVVYGSSLYNAGLQMADWVATAVRLWATGSTDSMLARIAKRFRSGPGGYVGGGLVLKPAANLFPRTPAV